MIILFTAVIAVGSEEITKHVDLQTLHAKNSEILNFKACGTHGQNRCEESIKSNILM